MPKSNIRRQYKINNWPEYNRALINRGSLTVWVEENAVEGWLAQREPKQRGRPKQYSDEAILMLITLRFVFHLPLRALQGFAASIFQLMGLDLPVPHYTQICRRAAKLKKKLERIKKRGGISIIFDSTGLKV